MKTKMLILILVLGAAVAVSLAYRFTPAKQRANEAAPSGADVFRIDAAIYDRVARAAEAGDCDAAFTLARHHAFYTEKYDDAIRWYRIAAKCPHVGAKGELLSMLRFNPKDDAEVDRLLSEIEKLDPQAAESDRQAVAMARIDRQRSNK